MLALSKEFGCTLPPEVLIARPSVAQFAEALDAGLVPGGPAPWFRLPGATLLPLREAGGETPLLFIPGGYTSENELLVFAGLMTGVNTAHAASGVRLNLHASRVLPPFSLKGLARAIGRAWLRRHGARVPVIVGECQACALACESAQWLSRKLAAPPVVALLDPWQPRSTHSPAPHPPAVRRYYDLLRRHEPARYPGEVHIVCASQSRRLAECHEWWRSRLGTHCLAHEVPGDHHTYIRAHKTHLAALLNDILRRKASGTVTTARGGNP
jgi:hypothetical protein